MAGQGRGQHPRGSYGKTVRWESKHFLVGDPSAAELPLALLDSIGAAIVYVRGPAPVDCETQKRDSGFKLVFCSCVACAIICASFFSRRCCLVVPVVCLCCDCTESLPCATNYE